LRLREVILKEIYVPSGGSEFRKEFFKGNSVREFEGATCTDRTVEGQGATAMDVAMVFVTFLNNVAAGFVAAALYEVLSGRADWIRIGGKKVPVSEEDIKRTLENEENKNDPKSPDDYKTAS
jgi:hypothetical protein